LYVLNRRNVSVVRVDPGEQAAVLRDHITDVHRALELRFAVAASSVQFAKVLHAVRRDVHSSSTVVLHNLVARAFGATAPDGCGSRSLADGNCILAYILEPDVLDCAGALAVNTLCLISADDDVPGGETS
jgi:hypothetical protein